MNKVSSKYIIIFPIKGHLRLKDTYACMEKCPGKDLAHLQHPQGKIIVASSKKFFPLDKNDFIMISYSYCNLNLFAY